MLFDAISPREREVLGHVLRGRLNKQIAGDLGIHERTVKVHRKSIMTKLNVRSVAALARLSQEAGVAMPGGPPSPKGNGLVARRWGTVPTASDEHIPHLCRRRRRRRERLPLARAAAARVRHPAGHLRLGRGLPRRQEAAAVRLHGVRRPARRHVGHRARRALARREAHRAPVIYITAHDDPETRASAEATGCAAYFRKNESGADVIEAIRRLTE